MDATKFKKIFSCACATSEFAGGFFICERGREWEMGNGEWQCKWLMCGGVGF